MYINIYICRYIPQYPARTCIYVCGPASFLEVRQTQTHDIRTEIQTCAHTLQFAFNLQLRIKISTSYRNFECCLHSIFSCRNFDRRYMNIFRNFDRIQASRWSCLVDHTHFFHPSSCITYLKECRAHLKGYTAYVIEYRGLFG